MFIDELLKKGVPVETPFPVLLSLNQIIFVIGTGKTKPIVTECLNRYNNVIVNKFGAEFADILGVRQHAYAELITDPNTLDRKIIMTPFTILFDLDNFFKSTCFMERRVDLLDNLIDYLNNSSEEDIKTRFPEYYEYYKAHCNRLLSLKQVSYNQKMMSGLLKAQNIKKYADLWGVNISTMQKWIEDSQYAYSINKFNKTFINIINSIKNNIDYFNTILMDLNNPDIVSFDMELSETEADRFDMLMAYTYLRELKHAAPENQQKYLYFLSDFLERRKDLVEKNRKLFLQDEMIKMQDLYAEYKQILVDNPSLRIVDFDYSDFIGMNVEEVDEFIQEYLKTFQVNWDIFSGTDIDNEMIERIKEKYTRLTGQLTETEIEQLISLFIRKKEFFDKTDPYYRLLGKEAFDGYVGYVYKNGLVVLEKFYENAKTGNIATESAIYTMDVKQFSKLTKLSKTQIIANNLCKRFIHKGDWRTKVSEYISSYSSDSNVVEEVSTLKQG